MFRKGLSLALAGFLLAESVSSRTAVVIAGSASVTTSFSTELNRQALAASAGLSGQPNRARVSLSQSYRRFIAVRIAPTKEELIFTVWPQVRDVLFPAVGNHLFGWLAPEETRLIKQAPVSSAQRKRQYAVQFAKAHKRVWHITVNGDTRTEVFRKPTRRERIAMARSSLHANDVFERATHAAFSTLNPLKIIRATVVGWSDVVRLHTADNAWAGAHGGFYRMVAYVSMDEEDEYQYEHEDEKEYDAESLESATSEQPSYFHLGADDDDAEAEDDFDLSDDGADFGPANPEDVNEDKYELVSIKPLHADDPPDYTFVAADVDDSTPYVLVQNSEHAQATEKRSDVTFVSREVGELLLHSDDYLTRMGQNLDVIHAMREQLKSDGRVKVRDVKRVWNVRQEPDEGFDDVEEDLEALWRIEEERLADEARRREKRLERQAAEAAREFKPKPDSEPELVLATPKEISAFVIVATRVLLREALIITGQASDSFLEHFLNGYAEPDRAQTFFHYWFTLGRTDVREVLVHRAFGILENAGWYEDVRAFRQDAMRSHRDELFSFVARCIRQPQAISVDDLQTMENRLHELGATIKGSRIAQRGAGDRQAPERTLLDQGEPAVESVSSPSFSLSQLLGQVVRVLLREGLLRTELEIDDFIRDFTSQRPSGDDVADRISHWFRDGADIPLALVHDIYTFLMGLTLYSVSLGQDTSEVRERRDALLTFVQECFTSNDAFAVERIDEGRNALHYLWEHMIRQHKDAPSENAPFAAPPQALFEEPWSDRTRALSIQPDIWDGLMNDAVRALLMEWQQTPLISNQARVEAILNRYMHVGGYRESIDLIVAARPLNRDALIRLVRMIRETPRNDAYSDPEYESDRLFLLQSLQAYIENDLSGDRRAIFESINRLRASLAHDEVLMEFSETPESDRPLLAPKPKSRQTRVKKSAQKAPVDPAAALEARRHAFAQKSVRAFILDAMRLLEMNPEQFLRAHILTANVASVAVARDNYNQLLTGHTRMGLDFVRTTYNRIMNAEPYVLARGSATDDIGESREFLIAFVDRCLQNHSDVTMSEFSLAEWHYGNVFRGHRPATGRAEPKARLKKDQKQKARVIKTKRTQSSGPPETEMEKRLSDPAHIKRINLMMRVVVKDGVFLAQSTMDDFEANVAKTQPDGESLRHSLHRLIDGKSDVRLSVLESILHALRQWEPYAGVVSEARDDVWKDREAVIDFLEFCFKTDVPTTEQIDAAESAYQRLYDVVTKLSYLFGVHTVRKEKAKEAVMPWLDVMHMAIYALIMEWQANIEPDVRENAIRRATPEVEAFHQLLQSFLSETQMTPEQLALIFEVARWTPRAGVVLSREEERARNYLIDAINFFFAGRRGYTRHFIFAAVTELLARYGQSSPASNPSQEQHESTAVEVEPGSSPTPPASIQLSLSILNRVSRLLLAELQQAPGIPANVRSETTAALFASPADYESRAAVLASGQDLNREDLFQVFRFLQFLPRGESTRADVEGDRQRLLHVLHLVFSGQKNPTDEEVEKICVRFASALGSSVEEGAVSTPVAAISAESVEETLLQPETFEDAFERWADWLADSCRQFLNRLTRTTPIKRAAMRMPIEKVFLQPVEESEILEEQRNEIDALLKAGEAGWSRLQRMVRPQNEGGVPDGEIILRRYVAQEILKHSFRDLKAVPFYDRDNIPDPQGDVMFPGHMMLTGIATAGGNVQFQRGFRRYRFATFRNYAGFDFALEIKDDLPIRITFWDGKRLITHEFLYVTDNVTGKVVYCYIQNLLHEIMLRYPNSTIEANLDNRGCLAIGRGRPIFQGRAPLPGDERNQNWFRLNAHPWEKGRYQMRDGFPETGFLLETQKPLVFSQVVNTQTGQVEDAFYDRFGDEDQFNRLQSWHVIRNYRAEGRYLKFGSTRYFYVGGSPEAPQYLNLRISNPTTKRAFIVQALNPLTEETFPKKGLFMMHRIHPGTEKSSSFRKAEPIVVYEDGIPGVVAAEVKSFIASQRINRDDSLYLKPWRLFFPGLAGGVIEVKVVEGVLRYVRLICDSNGIPLWTPDKRFFTFAIDVTQTLEPFVFGGPLFNFSGSLSRVQQDEDLRQAFQTALAEFAESFEGLPAFQKIIDDLFQRRSAAVLSAA